MLVELSIDIGEFGAGLDVVISELLNGVKISFSKFSSSETFLYF